MMILESDYNLDILGGFWVKVNHGINEYCLSCCLECRKNPTSTKEFKKEINIKNCGFNWGMCGDANEYFIERFGAQRCLNLILKGARLKGIRVINK